MVFNVCVAIEAERTVMEMAWNYRVVKKKLSEEEDTFDVCEVYYDEDGKPTSWAWGKNILSADSFEELQDILVRVQEAIKKPVLEIVGDEEGLVEIQEHVSILPYSNGVKK